MSTTSIKNFDQFIFRFHDNHNSRDPDQAVQTAGGQMDLKYKLPVSN